MNEELTNDELSDILRGMKRCRDSLAEDFKVWYENSQNVRLYCEFKVSISANGLYNKHVKFDIGNNDLLNRMQKSY